MERYVFVGHDRIPEVRIKDVEQLRIFIRKELNIFLSLIDTYKLWSEVSGDHYAGWLCIDYHYEGQSRGEFLQDQIEKYCRRV